MRKRIFSAGVLAAAAVVIGGCLGYAGASNFPDPAVDTNRGGGKQTAVFAGGCFWCTEAVFERLAGVESVVSGYAGGDKNSAHYDQVGSGTTNHAESIRVVFDPAQITYGQLLKVFFSVAHDPTTLNRQGPDWGRQYRSAIFYTGEEQKKIAEAYVKQLKDAKVFKDAIVTEIVKLPAFYEAEDYHQDFVKNHPLHPYVVANSRPKISKLEQYYPSLLKK